MLRRIPSPITSAATTTTTTTMIVVSATAFILLISVQRPQLTAATTTADAETNKQQHPQQEQELQLHPYYPVAVKFWIRNTEFGERDNWRDKSKPCTLLERIQMNEQSVVSMGDTLDSLSGSLEANMKELLLAMDGMLLLEEDTLSDTLDPMFIQYLNQSGDCVDGDQAAAQRVAYSQPSSSSSTSSLPTDDDATAANSEHLFQFEPDRDHMSWFNPHNWVSQAELDWQEFSMIDWVPDARRIPCDNDIVVFGDRQASTGPTIEANERSRVLSFKVNFEPSVAGSADELLPTTSSSNLRVNNIRVAKLKIGNQTYNQQEFDQLVGSNQYKNILFHFNSSRSLLRPIVDQSSSQQQQQQQQQQQDETGQFTYSSPPLTIDDSSIYPDTSTAHFCMDEAGCLCNNYQANVMKAICSFNYPLEEEEMLCRDPILTAGFCNKLCATVITVSMDPTKFKERFLLANLEGFFADLEKSASYLSKNVFVIIHRTHDTKYQILFQLIRYNAESDEIFFDELEFTKVPQLAQMFLQQLTNAKRSFYGIKSINLKYSKDWKKSTRKTLFWISFPFLFLIASLIYIFEEGLNKRVDSVQDEQELFLRLYNWLINFIRHFTELHRTVSEGREPFVQDVESKEVHRNTRQTVESFQNIPLVQLETDGQLITEINSTEVGGDTDDGD